MQMAPNELIMEVREFLSENVYTCFFTNYFLEHAGKELSDFEDISQLDLQTDNKIYMKPQLYTEKSVRSHIMKINDLLT